MPYPAPVVHGHFDPVTVERQGYPVDKPNAVPDRILRARVAPTDDWRKKLKKSLARVKLRPSKSPFHGVTRVNLLCEGQVSESFNAGNWPSSDPTGHFCFAHGKDDPKIGWKIRREDEIQKVVLELLCADSTGAAAVIHTKEITDVGVMRKDPYQHKTATKTDYKGNTKPLQWVGTMAFSSFVTSSDLKGAKLPGDDSPFPGGVLTAQYSPYKLRATVHSKSGKEAACWPPEAWTYFHVAIAEVRLGWFPLEDIDAFFPNGTDPEKAELARIKAVYTELLDKKDATNLKGNFPSRDRGETKRVYLRSNRFYPSNEALGSNWSFEQMKELWPEGVKIPILADAGYIRRANGQVARLPDAVGKMPFLWDYVDRARGSAESTSPFYAGSTTWPYEEPVIIEPVTGTKRTDVVGFLDQTLEYKTAESTYAPVGRNCHRDRGGKRGSATAAVFPANDGSKFPFKVRRLTGSGREWLSVSTLVSTDAKYLGKTGILFEPSRVAGDGYELHVYPALADDGANVALSQGGTPLGMSGRFQVWRRVDLLRYVVVADPATQTEEFPAKSYRDWIAKVREKFAQFHIDLRPIYKEIEEGKKARKAFLDKVHTEFDGWNGDGVAPDWMLAAFKRPAADTPAAEYVFECQPYATWRQKMLTAHGGGNNEAQLYAWARTTRQKFADSTGEEASFSIWNEAGMNPLAEPHPLAWQAYAFGTDMTKVEVRLPDVEDKSGAKPLVLEVAVIPGAPVPPNAPNGTLPGKPVLNAGYKAAVQQWVRDVMKDQVMIRATGKTSLCSYDPDRHPADVKVTLAAFKDDVDHRALLDLVKTEIEATWPKPFIEQAERCYWKDIGYAWGYNVLNVLFNKKLRASGEEGIVLVQGRLFPPNKPGTGDKISIPSGKSEASMGDRATAINWIAAGCREVVKKEAEYSETRKDEFGKPALRSPASTTYPAGTLVHETGHFLGVSHHAEAGPADCAGDPRDLHQRNPAMVVSRVMTKSGSTLDTDFCGLSMLRMQGWSLYAVDDTGAYTAPQNLAIGTLDKKGMKGAAVVNGDNIDYTAPTWANVADKDKVRTDSFTYELTGLVAETGMAVSTKVKVSVEISDLFNANTATYDSAAVQPTQTVAVPAIAAGKNPALGSRTLWNRAEANQSPDPKTNTAPAQPAWSQAGFAEITAIV